MRRTRASAIGTALTAIAMVVVACASVGQSAEAGPLGDRAVLEVKQGLPVPVTLTP